MIALYNFIKIGKRGYFLDSVCFFFVYITDYYYYDYYFIRYSLEKLFDAFYRII